MYNVIVIVVISVLVGVVEVAGRVGWSVVVVAMVVVVALMKETVL